MSDASDRRGFKRLSTSWIVRIRFEEPGDSTQVRLDERIRNASMGGVFIETRRPFRVGSLAEFEFKVPGSSDRVHAKGVVKWVNDDSQSDLMVGMGIEFVEVTNLTADVISDYIQGPESVEPLSPFTATPDHQALLKFYRENVGKSFKLDDLPGLVGVLHENLIFVLSDFAFYELISFSGDVIQFKKSSDENLVRAIEAWTPE